MLIDASHNEETRVVVLESKKLDDFDFESLKKLQIAGNIYLAKVTRVEPSLQAAFLDYGGNRHGFLAFSEIHPDYYQVPLEERLIRESESESKPTNAAKSRKVSRKKSTKKIAEKAEETVEEKKITSEIIPAHTDSFIKNNIELSEKKADKKHEDNVFLESEMLAEESLGEEPLVRAQHRKFRIQEVIKVRQILLIQVVKDERGNKGAALTTYLSLAGRYCVLMPNTPRGGGISRKITNLSDRKRLKDIANDLSVPIGSGLIIRTAGSNRTKLEIKRDYEYLLRQWEQVRDLTLSSIAPTAIYEEGSLIKRAIRDLYSRDIEEVLVEGERGYKEAKDYMKMFMPSHAKNVKKYENEVPLFSKFDIEEHLAAMFNPIAQLKSGGYIVINVTEALVAVDVNSGRATKESSIEDTALKTNLEAAEELARQIKLRDLAGLIVVDFIDMEERKNNLSVEKRMKDRLKNDRARTQIGRISTFGLLEMSRQRLRPGMIETSTQACIHCHGTGITRSDDSLSLAILRDLEEEGIKRQYDILRVNAPISIANYMLNEKRERIFSIETRYNLIIKVDADNELINPDYKIERIKNTNKLSNSNSAKRDFAVKDDKDNSIEQDPSNTHLDTNDDADSEENKLKKRRRRRKRQKQRQQALPERDEVLNETRHEDKAPTTKVVDEIAKENNGKPTKSNFPPKEIKPKIRKPRRSKEPIDPKKVEKPQSTKQGNDSIIEQTVPTKRKLASGRPKKSEGDPLPNAIRKSTKKSIEQKKEPDVAKRSGWWNK